MWTVGAAKTTESALSTKEVPPVADRNVTFRPGWLQRQVAKSVASLDELPAKIRASLGRSVPTRTPPEIVIADEFRRFLYEEGARHRSGDFADGLIARLGVAGWRLTESGPAEPNQPFCRACEIFHDPPLHHDAG
jgi:hypothetical protein